jgi:hypothetical protein
VDCGNRLETTGDTWRIVCDGCVIVERASLPYWPAALRLDQAAAYCGLSVDTFKGVCPIKPIVFTQSARGNRYLRASLDAWLASLDPNKTTSAPRRRLGDRIIG